MKVYKEMSPSTASSYTFILSKMKFANKEADDSSECLFNVLLPTQGFIQILGTFQELYKFKIKRDLNI
ncbi:hypothetical protein CHS0354_039109 [Potamilus streckersoni]|uniref:Uncharacterized protein n=1 Tax=Potamilus streckersoni TaxID=2493646 RepID=A0AAE0TK86_9BIVA|nr:hypothetical protein CHS0354_039109 [Potamilus streckersoni]